MVNTVPNKYLILDLGARKPEIIAFEHQSADQPAHSRSLVSAFVVHSLECVIAELVQHVEVQYSSRYMYL